MDWEPDSKLVALDNPYEPSERKDMDYLWDRAYYNGRYYSYFGITPIVTLIYPFYFISGIIPAPLLMQFIYIGIFAVVFPKLMMMLLDRYGKKVSSVFKVLLTYTSYVSSLDLLYGRGRNPFYYIACTAAIAFITWFAYLFFKGIFEEEHRKRCIYFVFAGLMFALSFHARVNTAFMAVFFIVPVVIGKLILAKKTWKVKLTEIGCLGLFVAVGFMLSFVYNYARFGNILDFGTNYQLTVTDVSNYKLDISEFDDAIKYYYEANLLKSVGENKVVFSDHDMESVDRYLYVSQYVGLYYIPFMMFGLMGIVMAFDKGKGKLYKITLLSTVLGGFIMAWINFCLGGVIFRYLADFSTEVAVCAALGVLYVLEQSYYFENKRVAMLLKVFIVLVMVVSIYKAFQIMTVTNGNLFDIRENTFIGRLFNIKNN